MFSKYCIDDTDSNENIRYIATELCAGTLQDWIRGKWKGPIIQALFDEKKMLHQVTKGLAYLHSRDKPIIHRDIKPSNILIYAPDEKTAAGGLVKPKMKIADFGLSTTLISGQADLSTRNNTDPDGTIEAG